MTTPDAPSFKGFLYWYVLIQITLVTALMAGYFTYVVIAAAAGVINDADIGRQAEAIDRFATPASILIAIVLCLIVASHHNLKFWPGFGGYWLGNIIATTLVIPMIIGVERAAQYEGLSSSLAMVAWMVGYAIICGTAIWWGRRRNRIRRQEAALIEPF